MAETFRAPKLVQEEAGENNHEIASRISAPLSLEDLVEIRSSWQGENGREWANRISESLQTRIATLTKGKSMTTEIREEPYGVDGDPVLHNVMAADAAMDAAQDLLANNIDPVVSQAYYLICAADAALSEVIEALGGNDADDEMAEPVAATEPADQVDGMLADQGMPPLRDAQLDPAIEARKTAMETAERITMVADIRSVATEDGSLKIGGYAATFNQEADGLNFREVIAPGAFTRTLQSDQPMFLLVNHDFESLPLASTQSGTLRLEEDSVGLRMEATLDPMNPRAAELASALTRGDVDKMSFAFTVAEGGDTREGGLRTLTDLDLYEVSVVTMPAYSSTSVGMRKAEDDNLALRKRQLQLKFNQLRLRK